MSAETAAVFAGLTSIGQAKVNEVWPQVMADAPRELWEHEIQWIVEFLDAHETLYSMSDSTGVEAMAGVHGGVHMRIGYTSAITGVYEVNKGLVVRLAVSSGAGGTAFCSNCQIVYKGAYAPPNITGYYTAYANHEAVDPQGWDESYATMYVP